MCWVLRFTESDSHQVDSADEVFENFGSKPKGAHRETCHMKCRPQCLFIKINEFLVKSTGASLPKECTVLSL